MVKMRNVIFFQIFFETLKNEKLRFPVFISAAAFLTDN